MATCHRALDCAVTDAQRLHTLLSLLSAALDMRRWDAVASASSRAESLSRRARPEEAARAQALRAHAAFYQGDMRAARELIQGCHDRKQTAAQTSRLTQHPRHDRHGARRLRSRRHGIFRGSDARPRASAMLSTSYMIEDNIACLEASTGAALDSALPRLRPRFAEQCQRTGPDSAVLRPDPRGHGAATLRGPRERSWSRCGKRTGGDVAGTRPLPGPQCPGQSRADSGPPRGRPAGARAESCLPLRQRPESGSSS